MATSSVDQGWAWVIMIGCFINILTSMTFIRSLSIFFLVFLERFQQSAAMTTLSFSLNTILFSIGSVIVPIYLLPRFSVRLVTLVGASLIAASIIGMAFSTSIIYIHIGFCVIGLAHPLIFISQTTLLGKYFKKKFSFAVAFANLGLSIATMVGPAFTQFLLDKYGLHGTILIHGGINLHNILACLLFRPNEEVDTELVKTDESDNDTELTKSQNGSNLDIVIPNRLTPENNSIHLARNIDDVKKRDVVALLNSRNLNPVHGSLSLLPSKQRGDTLKSDHTGSQPITLLSSSVASLSQVKHARSTTFSSASVLASDMLNTLSVSSNSMRRLNDESAMRKPDKAKAGRLYQKVTLISSDDVTTERNGKNSTTTTITMTTPMVHQMEKEKFKMEEEEQSVDVLLHINDRETKTRRSDNINNICSRWLRQFRESPFSHPTVWLLVLAAGFGVNTQCGSSYMPSLGKEQGVQVGDLPYLMTVIGASDLFKLAIGYFADKNVIKRIHITCLAQLISGVVFQFAGFFHGLVPMIVLSTIFGATTGILHVLLPGITVDLLGVSYIGHVMSGYFLVNGAVMSGTHVVVGLVKDNTDSFVGGYHFIGCMMLTGIVFLLLEPLVRRLRGTKVNSDDAEVVGVGDAEVVGVVDAENVDVTLKNEQDSNKPEVLNE